MNESIPLKQEKENIKGGNLTNYERKTYHELSEEIVKYRLSEDDFLEIFSKEEITKDRSKIEEKKEAMRHRTEESILLERFLILKAEENGWFGNGYVCPTTEFDDIINGVDFVVEFEKENKNLYLAVDCTVSEREDVIREKILKSKEKMEIGLLSQVKYFQSEADYDDESKGIKKIINMVPRVIMTVKKEELRELCEKYSKDKDLRTNYLQLLLLEEVLYQLVNQIDRIEKNKINFRENITDSQKERMVNVIREIKECIEDIVREKRNDKKIDITLVEEALTRNRDFDKYDISETN